MSITHVTPREMELQAEVTRMEAEVESMVAENHKLSNLWSAIKKERDELQVKLAALEAPEEPVWRDGRWHLPGDAKEPNHG